ncbi:MAG: hypothetical protein ACLTLQ_03440 [[Clostridium] scindens]
MMGGAGKDREKMNLPCWRSTGEVLAKRYSGFRRDFISQMEPESDCGP